MILFSPSLNLKSDQGQMYFMKHYRACIWLFAHLYRQMSWSQLGPFPSLASNPLTMGVPLSPRD